MTSFEMLPSLAVACVSGLVAVVLRDLDRRLATFERRLETLDKLGTAVAELVVEVRHLKERDGPAE